MSLRYLNTEMTMEDRSVRTGGRETLGLSFTIDYLLFNKGVKGSKEEATGSRTAEQPASNVLNHQNPQTEEVGIHSEARGKRLQRSEAKTKERKVKEEEEEEGDEEQQEEGAVQEATTANANAVASTGPEKSEDKPNQSYIALISRAILASEQKKLLLCDIYQWIMDHYPYFKSKDKNWRNSVRHNLSLNDCFVKAGRSDNGKGHFWAIHPTNYQDFCKGDYHCRRARRRVRRVTGHLPLSSLSSPHHHHPPHPAMVRPPRRACWCCPPPALPVSCLAPRLFWPWSRVQPHAFHPGFHAPGP